MQIHTHMNTNTHTHAHHTQTNETALKQNFNDTSWAAKPQGFNQWLSFNIAVGGSEAIVPPYTKQSADLLRNSNSRLD